MSNCTHAYPLQKTGRLRASCNIPGTWETWAGPAGCRDDVTAGWRAAGCPAQGWSRSGPWIQGKSRLQLFLQRKEAGTLDNYETEMWSESQVGIKLDFKT